MQPQPLDPAVRIAGRTAFVELRGDIDGTATDAMSVAYAATDGAGAIVLDFGQVGYINSTGIALIVGLLSKARVAGREVSAVGLSDHYRHIFEITRLSDFMAIREEPPTGVAPAAAAT